MLVCAVLMGKRYKCTSKRKFLENSYILAQINGAPCVKGYDSHTSPDGQEYVLFSPAQVRGFSKGFLMEIGASSFCDTFYGGECETCAVSCTCVLSTCISCISSSCKYLVVRHKDA